MRAPVLLLVFLALGAGPALAAKDPPQPPKPEVVHPMVAAAAGAEAMRPAATQARPRPAQATPARPRRSASNFAPQRRLVVSVMPSTFSTLVAALGGYKPSSSLAPATVAPLRSRAQRWPRFAEGRGRQVPPGSGVATRRALRAPRQTWQLPSALRSAGLQLELDAMHEALQ